MDNRSVEEATALREEKIALMNQLNGKIRADNKLAEEYKNLEDDYQDLKNEVNRLKRGNKHDGWSDDGDTIPVKGYREDHTKTKITDQARSRSRSRPVEETRQKYRSVETPEAENVRLREELARVYR